MTDANTSRQKTFVVDASFVLAYLLPDENEEKVEEEFSKFAENKINFISPNLLRFEIMNGLRSAVLQKRQSAKAAEILLSSFLSMGILFEKIDEREVFRLALTKTITAYDASYVWLARKKKLELLTLDENLTST